MRRIIFSSCRDCLFYEVIDVKGEVYEGLCRLYEMMYKVKCKSYRVIGGEIWYKCPLRDGITFRAMPLNSYVVDIGGKHD